MSKIDLSTGRRAARARLGVLATGAILWAAAPGLASADAALADLIERVSPSVVTVFTTQIPNETSMDQQFGFPEGSPFEEFFRRFGIPNGIPAPRDSAPQHALGSGFILDADGYVITNNHVVEDASEVKVKLNDKREFTATMVGTDKQTDLALLKIDAGGSVPHVTLGDSDKLRVGDDVVAVGNPFGLGGTVTTGIVSALGRDINAGPYVDFIQTDAAINRGNSGGPLFDRQGNVVGVNSAIYSPNGGSVGVGFAIPSDTVKTVVAQLRDGGSVSRGWLGVSIQPVTPEIADAMGLAEAKGALVAEVVDDGPSQSILKPGDLILSFDGTPLQESRDLPKLVGATKTGSKVAIDILRKGKPETVHVKIGALPSERHAANAAEPDGQDGAASEKLGATVAALSPEARRQLGLGNSVDGAVVTALKGDGAASVAGLQVGDVIVQVGGQPVSGPSDLDDALGKIDTQTALLLINRHGIQIFVGVKLAA